MNSRSWWSLLLLNWPCEDERLSWPCWLTYSGWLTHQLQARCRPVKVRWSPSYHQPTHPHIYKGRCSQNDSFTKSWIAYSVPQFFLEISYLNWEVMWTVKSEFLQTTHNKIAEMLAMRCLCLDSRCLTLLIITSITTNEQPTKWYLSCMTSDVKRILHEDGSSAEYSQKNLSNKSAWGQEGCLVVGQLLPCHLLTTQKRNVLTPLPNYEICTVWWCKSDGFTTAK